MKIRMAAAALALLAEATAFAEPPTPPPPAPADAQPETLLPALAEHSRSTMRLENGRLTGPGGDLLRNLGGQARFVVVGEEHGNAGIARFAAALWGDLNEAGYEYLAVEIDPWAAAAMERELRRGGVAGWGAFLEQNGGAVSAPFFSWQAEAEFVEAATRASSARPGTAIWGIDQVFIGAAPWLLGEVAENAADPQARRMARGLADAARGNLNWLGQSERAPLEALRARLSRGADARYRALIDAMLESQEIYRPFTGAGGETWIANTQRERLMRRQFLSNLQAAETRARGSRPRVMVKVGAYHAYRGATPTHVQGLGGFLTELAAQNGEEALTVYALCGPGSQVAAFVGPPTSCDQGFAENWSFLAPHVSREEMTVIDLRAWRLRPRRWRHLSADIRQIIDSFDILVVVPNAEASRFIDGVTPPTPPP